MLLLVPSLANPYFADVHKGAARAGAAHGIGVIVYPLDDAEGEGPFPSPLRSVDGVLACAVSAEKLDVLRDGVATVALDCGPDAGDRSVTMDVGAGMRSAVDHLVHAGHGRVLHIRAERDAWTFARRAQEFDRQVAAHQGVVGRSLVVPFQVARARARIEAVLRDDRLITGVVCDDDNLATCVYSAARGLGLTIPDDLSVIGFDDLPFAAGMTPALTTVRLPAQDLGRVGMENFLRIGSGVEKRSEKGSEKGSATGIETGIETGARAGIEPRADSGTAAGTVLPVTLIERASTAPPRP